MINTININHQFIVITPINKTKNSPSNIDYKEQLKRVKTGEGTWCWDDTRFNNAKVGELFGFMFINSRVVIHVITSIKNPENRLPSWSKNVGQGDRRVLELSIQILEINWQTWMSLEGIKSARGTFKTTNLKDKRHRLFNYLVRNIPVDLSFHYEPDVKLGDSDDESCEPDVKLGNSDVKLGNSDDELGDSDDESCEPDDKLDEQNNELGDLDNELGDLDNDIPLQMRQSIDISCDLDDDIPLEIESPINGSIEEPEKPWSINQFEEYRPHMTNWVKTNISRHLPSRRLNSHINIKRILIHGQVKVGKREIVEYIALRDENGLICKHVFISSFHRKSDEGQRDELEEHNVKVFSINQRKKQLDAIQYIEHELENQMKIIIHWDECDYGTGDRQILANIYNTFRDEPNVFHILYSATPEEYMYSNEIANENNNQPFILDFYETGIVLNYIPPHGYCGVSEFMNHGLVHDAQPFFEIVSNDEVILTNQGREIIESAKKTIKQQNRILRNLKDQLDDAEEENNMEEIIRLNGEINSTKIKNIIILRITYKVGDDDDNDNDEEDDDVSDRVKSKSEKAIYKFLKNAHLIPELKNICIYADKNDVNKLNNMRHVLLQPIKWSNKLYWDQLRNDKLIIIVHDQTSTRSTEWVFHDRIYATHDYRKRITFNTALQAQLRVAHYEQKYGSFQKIKVYGHLKTFQLCAGLISVSEYVNNDWIIRKIPKSNPPKYRLKSSDPNKKLPTILGGKIPDVNGYAHDIAQQMLIQLGCTNNGGTKISQRVRGNCKNVPIINSQFYPCNEFNVESVINSILTDNTNQRIYPYVKNFNPRVNSIFNPKFKLSDGTWQGCLRERKVFQYDDIKDQLWGIRLDKEKRRFTVCYNNGELGLCLRVATGELRTIDSLETYKSMYNVY
jgi:hypothetical protein